MRQTNQSAWTVDAVPPTVNMIPSPTSPPSEPCMVQSPRLGTISYSHRATTTGQRSPDSRHLSAVIRIQSCMVSSFTLSIPVSSEFINSRFRISHGRMPPVLRLGTVCLPPAPHPDSSVYISTAGLPSPVRFGMEATAAALGGGGSSVPYMASDDPSQSVQNPEHSVPWRYETAASAAGQWRQSPEMRPLMTS